MVTITDRQIILDGLSHERADLSCGEARDDVVRRSVGDELADQVRGNFSTLPVDEDGHLENEIPVGPGPFMGFRPDGCEKV